tara:strand:- start:1030 stop:1788 length:759 start_codon:yes stop_codon:yes gene_type:complete
MAHYVIVLGGGIGSRTRLQTPKQFLDLGGFPIIMHSIKLFYNADPNCKIFVGISENRLDYWSSLKTKHSFDLPHFTFKGGKERFNTVQNGIQEIKNMFSVENEDILSVHDGARPFITKKFIWKLLKHAKIYGSAVPYLPVKSTLINIKKSNSLSHNIFIPVDRSNYILTQTPQLFLFNKISACYNRLSNNIISKSKQKKNSHLTDDSSIYKKFKVSTDPDVTFIKGEEENIKITTPFDIENAKFIWNNSQKK